MPLVPKSIHAKIQFFLTRAGRWAEHADQIGTSPELVARLAGEIAAARACLLAQEEAANAARTATARLAQAVRAMERTGADVVKQVRTRAAVDKSDAPYTLAQIPGPAPKAPIGPPGTPARFAATLLPDGSLALRWACPNPRGAVGTMYQVWRRAGATGEFALIGTTGTKSLVDAGVPAGAAAPLYYRVQAVRSTATGTAAVFVVNLGVGGGGAAAGLAIQTRAA